MVRGNLFSIPVKLYFLTRSCFKWSCFQGNYKYLKCNFAILFSIRLFSLLYTINICGSQSCILFLLPARLTSGQVRKVPW